MLAPMTKARQWWLRKGGELMGPFTLHQVGRLIRNEHVGAHTACSADQSTWITVADEPAFDGFLGFKAPKRVRGRSADPGRRMRKAIGSPPTGVIVVCGFLLLSALVGLGVGVLLLTTKVPERMEDAAALQRTVHIQASALILLSMAQGWVAVMLYRGYRWARDVAMVLTGVALLLSFLPIDGHHPAPWFVRILYGLLLVLLLSETTKRYTHKAAVWRAADRPGS